MRTITYYLSLFLIFVIPIEGMVRFPGIGSMSKAAGLVVAVIWVLTVLIDRRFRKPGILQILLILFVAWNALSLVWSADPNRTASHVFTWIQLLGMSLMLWDIYTTRPAILNGLQAFVLGAYVAIASAVSNYFAGNSFYTNFERFASGTSNPDGFGFIVALGVPIAWYLAALKNTGRRGMLWRLVNYAYIPAAFFGLALSGTRTALIATIVGMLFGLIMLTRVRLWIRVAVFLVLAGSVIWLLTYTQPLKSFQRLGTTATELTEGDLNNRTNNWREGLKSFEENPLLGVGGNMYRTVNSWGKVAHNTYLSVLVELGAVGFLLFIGMIAVAFIAAWGQVRLRDRIFWLTLLAVWGIGATTLTWEHRKTTWLFLSMIVANAAVIKAQAVQTARKLQAVETELLAAPNTQPGD